MKNEKVISVMKRYELKYRLTKDQVAYFKEAILDYMQIDKYGLTTISSIYYDTPNYSLINRSIEKPLFKEKIRLRSYGLSTGHSPAFLEIKRKSDKVVYKRRIVTNEQSAENILMNHEEIDDSQIARELRAFIDGHITLEPKYLIIYDRIAYYQDNSDVRITLDMNPRYRTTDLNLHTSLEGTSLLDEGEAILEIKVQNSIPLWLVKILTKGKIYQTSFSKVGTAHKMEMLKRNRKTLDGYKPINIEMKGEYRYGFII